MSTAGIPTITLLGPFALRVAGREVMDLPRKGQALLAFLAMQPDRRVSRELVADLLWTQSGEEQARHSLRQLLVVLRRTPARDVIRTSADKVWIDGTSIEVDALALEADSRAGDPEALLRAASCCRGALLQDIPAISHAFEEWLRPQRARMAGVMARTLRRLAASQIATGAFDEASGTAARLVEMDTLDEAAHRLLMECLARAGRRAEALQQFEFCVRTLRRELDVSPDPETVTSPTVFGREMGRMIPPCRMGLSMGPAAPRPGYPRPPMAISRSARRRPRVRVTRGSLVGRERRQRASLCAF